LRIKSEDAEGDLGDDEKICDVSCLAYAVFGRASYAEARVLDMENFI